jgi:hypothetical protein
MSDAKTPIKLKGDFAGYEYSWVTLPPIRELSGTSLDMAIKNLLASVNDFATPVVPGIDKQEFEGKEGKLWNKRIEDTRTVIGMVGGGSDLNLGYTCFGVMVGVICMIDTDPFYVCELVTHPGAGNAGEILIEEACNRSEQAGHQGRLELYSLTEQSTDFYLSVGFAKDDGKRTGSGKMSLVPTGNDKWTRLGDRWVLTRTQGKSYYKGGKSLPPIPPRPPTKT